MEKEKLYDKWTATGLETIKVCVEDKIANYCELNKKQCQEVLNLIEKQQKAIEDLKAITREYESYKVGEGNNIVIASKNWFVDGFFEEYLNKYISKDKIKAKIEEITSYAYTSAAERDCQDYAIQSLKELLGE